MKTNSKILGAALAVATCLFSANAFAAVFYTDWQVHGTGIRNTGAAGDTTLTFDQFDPALGVLHNVELLLGADGYATYRYEDISGDNNTFTFIADITVTVPNPLGGAPLIVTVPGLSDITRTVGPFETYQVPGFPDPLAGLTGTDADAATYVGASLTPALAALFTGPGTIDLMTQAAIAFSFNGDNDALTTVISRYAATLSLRYSYEIPTVPEPASLALLGIGMTGLGFIRRRRAG